MWQDKILEFIWHRCLACWPAFRYEEGLDFKSGIVTKSGFLESLSFSLQSQWDRMLLMLDVSKLSKAKECRHFDLRRWSPSFLLVKVNGSHLPPVCRRLSCESPVLIHHWARGQPVQWTVTPVCASLAAPTRARSTPAETTECGQTCAGAPWWRVLQTGLWSPRTQTQLIIADYFRLQHD